MIDFTTTWLIRAALASAALFPPGSGSPPAPPGSTAGTAAADGDDRPALVNAPVAPDAIYVARSGGAALSVVDLNGFGQGTGNPSFDFTYQTFPKGNTNFPNNPNLIQYGFSLHPPLFPGSSTEDGGSAGVFTLTRNTRLEDELVSDPVLASVGDMALGHSLDLVFSNGKDSTGCIVGGGNFCAIWGLKLLELAFGPGGTLIPTPPGQASVSTATFAPNPISFAPHPNPPKLTDPPTCLLPLIDGMEPTSSYSAAPLASGGLGFANLLVPGDPLGDPVNGVPPMGLLASAQNGWFVGPDRASLPGTGSCKTYQFRQQIGHFLYVVDGVRGELVALNSNRMQVLGRIAIPGPRELATSPDLDLLAVTSSATDSVFFVDIDPASTTFHQIVKVTPVGSDPSGIAWDPGGEDVLVCNEGDGSVSVISAFSLTERKRVGDLGHPFEVVITQRQEGFGFDREVYFGWILNRRGELWLFESGPDGVNGWGYDDIVGKAPFHFERPRQIAVDVTALGGAVWIAHTTPLLPTGAPTGEAGGALTRVAIESSVVGKLPLVAGAAPAFRDMTLAIETSLGESVLTGVPVDLAFDDQVNLGALPNVASSFSVGPALQVNGKSQVKLDGNGNPLAAKHPGLLFVAVPESSEGHGAIDVISLGTLDRVDTDAYQRGVQSIPVPGVTGLADYWRQ